MSDPGLNKMLKTLVNVGDTNYRIEVTLRPMSSWDIEQMADTFSRYLLEVRMHRVGVGPMYKAIHKSVDLDKELFTKAIKEARLAKRKHQEGLDAPPPTVHDYSDAFD